MAKTDWQLNDTVQPADMNQIGQEINELDAAVGDMSLVPTIAKDAAGAITELFTNVSDGKALIADAITGKGVPTSAEDTFQEMADNIGGIVLGSGNAQPADVLSGKTFSNDSGPGKVGTMPNRGAVVLTPGQTAQTIPAGYHNGGGNVPAVTFDASKVLNDTIIAGKQGTMPYLQPDVNDQRLATAISQGPHSGDGKQYLYFGINTNHYYSYVNWIRYHDPSFIASNIRDGVNMFGLVGNYKASFKAGDKILINDSFQANYYNGSTPTLAREVRFVTGGVFRISYELVKMVSDSLTVYGQIYKNGSPYGALRSLTTQIGPWPFTEDLSFDDNDLCALYYWASGSQVTVRNLKVSSDLGAPVITR